MTFTLTVTWTYYVVAAIFVGMALSAIAIASTPRQHQTSGGAVLAFGFFIEGVALGVTLTKWLGAQ